MKPEVLRMDHIVSIENNNPVLNLLSLQIFEGEIFGLLSLENHGLDKLVDLICWNTPIDSGHIYFHDKLVNSSEKSDRTRNKVSVISHKSSLIEDLSLADNLFVLRPGFKRFRIPEKIILEQTYRLLNEWNISISPNIQVKYLTAYQRIIIEIMRAVVAGEKLIILFDISALISSEDLIRFHVFLKKLSCSGVTFIYIYNHHEVLKQVCDRIAIFKSSRIEKVFSSSDDLQKHIHVLARYAYKKMSELRPDANKSFRSIPDVVKFNQVSSGSLKNLSFSIKVGEIVLIIDKSNTVLDIVSALIQQESTPYSGIIDLPSSMSNNKKLSNNIIERNPIHTVLFPELSYIENLCFLLAEKIPYFWQKKHLAKSVIREYRPILGDVILEPNLYHMTNKELYTLLYYRYIITRPDLVVCIQPLSGADMYLRTHILKLIIKMRNNDIAVLILDTELYDTLNIVDRLIQIESGKITSELNRTNFNVDRDMNEQLLPE